MGQPAPDRPISHEQWGIDVFRAIDRAWESLSPGAREDGVTTDLNDQLEREIEHYEETFVGDLEGH